MIYLANVRSIFSLINTPIGLHLAFRLIPGSNKTFVSMNRPLPAHCISIKIARTDVVHLPYTQGKTSEPLIHIDPIFLKNLSGDDAIFAHIWLCRFIKILHRLKTFQNFLLERQTSSCKFCVIIVLDRQLKTIHYIKDEGNLSSNKQRSTPHMPPGKSVAPFIFSKKGA